MNPQNNNKKPKIREKRFNDFLATNLDSTINDRYCRTCHVRLVYNPRNSPYDKGIYTCPTCNCTANINQTEPEEKLVVAFPTHNARSTSQKKLITQPDDQRLSRRNYFINKNMQARNELENTDPHLKMLRARNDITINNVEYYEPIEEDY